nr:hypothetical protein BaRGS_006399 [Batillaria attramentaria]
MLGALFAVNNIENNGCGEFSASLLRGVTAVTWFLDQLNAMDYVPGVTLGLHAYRTCHSSEVAARGAIELMETYKILGTDVDWNATTPLLGLLGPSTTNEAIVVSRMIGSMPEDKRLLQISGSATGEALSDRTLYPNFFRVIPPDSTQVDVLAELLVQLKWNYVAIVYNDDAYGRHAATQLRGQAQDRGICVPVFAALPLDYKSIHFRDEVRTIILQIDVGKGSPVKGVVFIGRAIIAKTFVRQLESRDHWMRIWENRSREGALHCGEIRTLSGSDLVQNVIFAVDQVNSKSRSFAGIFGDKKLGVIILDSCYRELVIKERLIELYNGKLLLPDGTNSSQILPLIAGVVGDYYSTTSWCRRGLLQHNQLVIYDPSDVYTSTVRDGMNAIAPQYNICIAQSLPTKYEDTDMNLDVRFNDYFEKNFLCDEVTSERLVEALKTVKLDLYNTGQPVKVFDDNGDGDIGYTVFQISRGDAADSLEYTELNSQYR